jgi:hypothetical protein
VVRPTNAGNFDDLLTRLAKIKSVPATPAARASGVAPRQDNREPSSGSGFISQSQTTQLGLRDAVLNSFRNSSALDYNQIRAIAAGQSPVTSGPRGLIASTLNSAPAKAVLNGLNTIGYPMRMVTSGLKEAKDAFDTDPNTRAGWDDYWRQVKDPSYGFGRVVPMEGWGGRFVGFAGDMFFDPINWLTLGGAGVLRAAGTGAARGAGIVAAREGLESAAREGAEGVARGTLSQRLGGVKTLANSDGRLQLAEEAKRLGASTKVQARIASEGKTALPPELAKVMGLGKAGIYIAGTGVRLPGTGLLATAMERGLVQMRLGILRHSPGKQLQSLMTRRGVNADTKRYRMLLAKGELPEDEIELATTVLTADARARSASAIARDAAARRAIDYAADTDVSASRGTVYKVIENSNTYVASASERKAADRVLDYFSKQLADINRRFMDVDEGYIPNVLNNYVPHVLSDAARLAMDKAYANPKMEQLMTYLKMNPLDAQGSLKHRHITADTEFMGVSGSVHKGTIDGINAVTREQLGFDLFETDIIKIMNKYSETVGGAAGTAEMMRVFKDTNFLKYKAQQGILNPEWAEATGKAIKDVTKSLDDKANQVVDALDNVTSQMDDAFDNGYLGRMVYSAQSITDSALGEAQQRAGIPLRGKDSRMLGAEGPLRNDVGALMEIDKMRLAVNESRQDVNLRAAEFSALFSKDGEGELNVVHQIMTLENQRLNQAFDAVEAKLFALRSQVESYGRGTDAQGRKIAGPTRFELDITIPRREATLAVQAAKNAAKEYSATIRDYQFWADDFGSWMQESLQRVGKEVEDVTYDPVTGKILEKAMVKTRTKSLMPKGVSEKSEEILMRVIDVKERKVVPRELGLGDNWLSSTFGENSLPSAAKALVADVAPRLLGQPKRIQAISSDTVSKAVIRGMAAADNAESLSDSFGWMTIRLLKEAERRAGPEARDALARQLNDGVGSIGQIWQRAKQQMDILEGVQEVIGLSARRKTDVVSKLFGKDAVDAADTLASLNRSNNEINDKIMELSESTSGNAGVLAESMFNDVDDFFSRTFRDQESLTEYSIDTYVSTVDNLINYIVDQGIATSNAVFDVQSFLQIQLKEFWEKGVLKRAELNNFHNEVKAQIGELATAYATKQGGKQNQDVLRQMAGLQKQIRDNNAKIDAITSGKSGNNDFLKYTISALSGDLRTQVAAVAETMQEYFIFNEAYYWFSAFQNIAPKNVVIPESVWSVLVATTAREQFDLTRVALDENVRAREIVEGMRDRILLRLNKPEHANALAQEFAALGKEQRGLVTRVFGTLLSGQDYKSLSEIDRLVTTDSRYKALTSDLLNLLTTRYYGDVKTSTVPVTQGKIKIGEREVTSFTGSARARGRTSQQTGRSTSSSVGAVGRQQTPAEFIASFQKTIGGSGGINRLRKALSSADGASLIKRNLLTRDEAERFSSVLDAVTQDAVVRRSQVVEGLKEAGVVQKGKRQMKSEIRGDEFGLGGLFTAATKSRSRGTGPAVSEWFARALGGNGKVYTGVGGKYRTTGTFALNPFAHGGDVFMGSTFGPVYKKDEFGRTLYDDMGEPIIDSKMTGDVDAPLAKQTKTITDEESHLGIARRRLLQREYELRRLSEDMTVTEEVAVGRLPDGTVLDADGRPIVGARPETDGMLGEMGYLLALEGQISETKDAIAQFRLADLSPKKIKELENEVFKVKARASKEEKQAAALLQADYELFNASRNPEIVSFIERALMGDPNVPLGRIPLGLPKRVQRAVIALNDARRAQEAIASSHSYLTSVDRRSLHKFIKMLAGYNLGHSLDDGSGGLRQLSNRSTSVSGPQNRIYSTSDFALLKSFADRVSESLTGSLPEGAGSSANTFSLFKATPAPFVPEEAASVIASKRKDYVFVKNNRRFSDEMVAAFISANRNANLRPDELALVRQAIDDRTVDIYKLDPFAYRTGDVFDPENTLVVVTGRRGDPVTRRGATGEYTTTEISSVDFIHRATDAFGNQPPVRDTTLFPTMDVNGRTVPIMFDELEWDQLFARPKDVRQVRNKLSAKEAERKKLASKMTGSNFEKTEPKLRVLDAEIEDLKIQIVRNDGPKQMEMVSRARAMREYFSQPEVKAKLGMKGNDSPEKVFEKWAELNAKGMSIQDTPEFVKPRTDELDEAWKNSYEYEILSQHRDATTAGKNATAELQTALYGGRAAQLVSRLSSLEKTRAQYLEKAGRSVRDAMKQLEKYAIDIVSESGNTASRTAAAKLNTTVDNLAALLSDPARRTPAVREVMDEYTKEINKVIRDGGLIDTDIFGPSGLLRSVTGEEVVSGQAQGVYAEKIVEALEKRTAIVRKRVEDMKASSVRTKAGRAQLDAAGKKALAGFENAQQMVGRAGLYDSAVRFEVAEATAMVKNWETAIKETEVAKDLAEKELKAFDSALASGKVTKGKSVQYVNEYFKVQKSAQRAAKGLSGAIETLEVAEAKLASATSAFGAAPFARVEANELWARSNNLKKLRNSMTAMVKTKTKDKMFVAEFENFSNDVDLLLRQLDEMASIPGEVGELNALRNQMISAREQHADWLIRYNEVEDMKRQVARIESVVESGDESRFLQQGIIFVNKLEEGMVEFNKQFPNLQADPRIMEIFENAHRLRDPEFARAMQRFLGPYTKFFKAWAVATPGFHVRNSISNGFMLIAAGGNPERLSRGLKSFIALKEEISNGGSIETFLAKLSPDEKIRAEGAYFAMMGSGGGLMSDVDLSAGSRLYSNKFTKFMQRQGIKADQHARYMLAYDGMDSGMDALTATASVKRFMVDYEDTSTLDSYLRQIVPFWMWTSRNLPLQMQNIFLNPKPYRFYTSFSNNFRDEDETEKLPKYMREVGAFALPGGKTMFAPDLPFSRIGQQIEQLQSPKRLFADVNPAIRVPLEVLFADKKFYSDIPFKEGLQPTGGPLATVASYLAQPLGQGGTRSDGTRGVTDKALYALMNTIPLAGQFERLVPSTETYQSRPISQRLLQYGGIPTRPITENMKQQELERRLFEISRTRREQRND